MADLTPILIKDLSEQTTAADTDYMVIGGADAKKIKWSTIVNLIRAKLGIGTAANLNTTSKEIVGAINELNTNIKYNKLLWSGSYYMSSQQTITLLEAISAQPKGIVLIFSRYNNGTLDEGFTSFFVPKHYTAVQGGRPMSFFMAHPSFAYVANKYLSIADNLIAGADYNVATGTASGITYQNNAYVLRYVIGV